MKSTRFRHIPQYSESYINASNSICMDLILAFYHYVKEKDYHVVFLSERCITHESCTTTHLHRCGLNIDGLDDVVLRPKEDRLLSSGIFKSSVRRNLVEEEGFEIAATIGDQDSDFDGGHTGLQIKLPNLLYLIE